MRTDVQFQPARSNSVPDVPPNFATGGFNRGVALKPVKVVDLEHDTFQERRASQAGAGVNYDPESLCLGSEDYTLPRQRGTDWQDPDSKWQAACRAEIPVSQIPVLFPRKRTADLTVDELYAELTAK